MKKFLSLLVCIFLIFVSCSNNNTIKEPSVCGYKFTYEQHEYIMFTSPVHGGIVHNPECWCMIDYE